MFSRRRSSLLARFPVRLYPYRLHAASRNIAALRMVKGWIRSPLKALAVRRRRAEL